MKFTGKKVRHPELREYLRSNEERLYQFCYFMLGSSEIAEMLLVDIVREFGSYYTGYYKKAQLSETDHEVNIVLYRYTWEKISERIHDQGKIEADHGRDLRQYQGLEDNLLEAFDGDVNENLDMSYIGQLRLRILQVDADFRAPVVLRDILGLDDSDIAKILSIRWGVYRHRLHRGRMELLEHLKGKPSLGLRPPRPTNTFLER